MSNDITIIQDKQFVADRYMQAEMGQAELVYADDYEYHGTVARKVLIRPPVSIDDLRAVFSTNLADLGQIICQAPINKWAKWKPVIKAGRLTHLKVSECEEVNYGLTPQVNGLAWYVLASTQSPKTLGATVTIDGVETELTWENILAANKEWTYNRPTGGMAAPFRLTDFANAIDADGSIGTTGYDHNASAPLKSCTEWTITKDTLEAICSADNSWTEGTGKGASSSYNYIQTGRGDVYVLNMRWGTASWQNWGGLPTDTIPVTDLLSSLDADGNYYRLGLIVRLRDGATGAEQLHLVVGCATMWEVKNHLNETGNASDELQTPPYFCPNLMTNQRLAWLLLQAATDGKAYSIVAEAIPVMVKNVQLFAVGNSGQGDNSSHSWTQPLCADYADSAIYSMPCDMQPFKIYVHDTSIVVFDYGSEDNTHGYGYEIVSAKDSDGNDVIAYPGGDMSSANRQYVRLLTLRRDDTTAAQTFQCYYIAYWMNGRDSDGHYTWGTVDHSTLPQTVTMSAGVSTVVLQGGPALYRDRNYDNITIS